MFSICMSNSAYNNNNNNNGNSTNSDSTDLGNTGFIDPSGNTNDMDQRFLSNFAQQANEEITYSQGQSNAAQNQSHVSMTFDEIFQLNFGNTGVEYTTSQEQQQQQQENHQVYQHNQQQPALSQHQTHPQLQHRPNFIIPTPHFPTKTSSSNDLPHHPHSYSSRSISQQTSPTSPYFQLNKKRTNLSEQLLKQQQRYQDIHDNAVQTEARRRSDRSVIKQEQDECHGSYKTEEDEEHMEEECIQPSQTVFDTLDEAKQFLKRYMKDAKIGLVICDSRKDNYTSYRCDRGGNYRDRRNLDESCRRRKLRTRKCNCQFKLLIKLNKLDHKWHIIVKNLKHNHLLGNLETLPILRRRDSRIKNEIKMLLDSGFKNPTAIRKFLMAKYEGIVITKRDIYNEISGYTRVKKEQQLVPPSSSQRLSTAHKAALNPATAAMVDDQLIAISNTTDDNEINEKNKHDENGNEDDDMSLDFEEDRNTSESGSGNEEEEE